MTFGMIYWLMPRLFQAPLWSKKLANTHFWIATIGILLYIVPIYVAGLTQGLMWRAIDSAGNLAYPDFVETVRVLMPDVLAAGAGRRAVPGRRGAVRRELPEDDGGAAGEVRGAGARGAAAGPRLRRAAAGPSRGSRAPPVLDAGPPDRHLAAGLVAPPLGAAAVPVHGVGGRSRWSSASLFEIIPPFLIRSNVPTIASVRPYTPLELAGRDMYMAEGCYNCHSQMIRPILAETKRYGEYSKPGEFVYDHPFQWGSRRIGPDLAREGGKQSPPVARRCTSRIREQVTQGSIMPAYPWLLTARWISRRSRSGCGRCATWACRTATTRSPRPSPRRSDKPEIAGKIAADKGPAGLGGQGGGRADRLPGPLGKDLFAPPAAEGRSAENSRGGNGRPAATPPAAVMHETDFRNSGRNRESSRVPLLAASGA